MTSYTLSAERRALLAVVAADPMRSSATYADMLGRSRKEVGQMLARMAAERLIRQCTATMEDCTESDGRTPEFVYGPVRTMTTHAAVMALVESALADTMASADILATALERLRGDERAA